MLDTTIFNPVSYTNFALTQLSLVVFLIKDSLFKFKANFSKQTKDFYIGKRIHNPMAYDHLKSEYIAKYNEEKFESVKAILQFYRME